MLRNLRASRALADDANPGTGNGQFPEEEKWPLWAWQAPELGTREAPPRAGGDPDTGRTRNRSAASEPPEQQVALGVAVPAAVSRVGRQG